MAFDLRLDDALLRPGKELLLFGADVAPLELRRGVDGREWAGLGEPSLGPDLPQGVVGNQVLEPGADLAHSLQDEACVQEAADVDEDLVGKGVQADQCPVACHVDFVD